METHSSILAWKIPWMEEPGGYSPWDRKELDRTFTFIQMNMRQFLTSVYLYPAWNPRSLSTQISLFLIKVQISIF